jgi:RNAse (barnase) inhibitor barstar
MPQLEVTNAFMFGEDRLSRQPQRIELRIPAGLATERDLLNVLDEGLRFPDYFGGNWDALWECICDLSWLDHAQIIVIHQDLPMKADAAQCRTYLSIMGDAVRYWARRPEHELIVVFPRGYETAVGELLEEDSSASRTPA